MKKLIPLACCLLASQAGAWSLTAVEAEPIPQQEFFQLLHPAALGLCGDAQVSFNLSPEECRSSMNARQRLCAETVGRGEPAQVGSQALARALMLDYLQCVSPGHDCNGVEVRTLEEAERHCS